jgi:peptidoglycan/xylan/chitin deacetylase (PgdA/CDA1 family)
MNPFIKNLALLALGNRYVIGRKLSAIRKAGVLTILNLHRVAEDDESSYRPLNPNLFNQLLIFLKNNFDLTTFGELKAESSSGKPKLILSFDDGYKDFIDVAVPILERHRIRVNQNIIPDCAEQQLAPLNVIATDFIGKAPSELLEQLQIPGFDTTGMTCNRMLMGERVSMYIKFKPMSEQKKLGDVLLPQFFNWDGFIPTPMMSREEIRQLMKTHEIGAHSYSHATMEYETDAYLHEDLKKCRDYFDRNLKSPVDIYAFPNGKYRKNQLQIARASGYRYVLAGEDLFSKSELKIHRRIQFDARSEREVLFRAVGGLAKVGRI